MARRCGYRKPGKAYFVVERQTLERLKLPVLFFLQDPPEPIDPSIISAQGITVLPRVAGYSIEDGQVTYALDAEGNVIYDVYDWVGGDYPDVVTFIEEALEQGISRLTPKTSDFGNIGYESEYRLVHPSAVIADPRPFFKARVNTGRKPCPKDLPHHMSPTQEWIEYYAHTCAGLWWEDVTEFKERLNPNGRSVVVETASGVHFRAAVPPDGVQVERQAGIFMRFPVGRLGRWDVIKSEDGAHQEALERLKRLKDGIFRRTRLTDM